MRPWSFLSLRTPGALCCSLRMLVATSPPLHMEVLWLPPTSENFYTSFQTQLLGCLLLGLLPIYCHWVFHWSGT